LHTVRLLLVAILVGVFAVTAQAAGAPRASLPDIEDEVMCVECGTVLSVSSSPVAQQERQFIRDQIAAGKTKDEIKAALVAEYGDAILAMPDEKGFNLAVYLVPGVLVLLGAAALATTARRWRGKPAVPAAESGAELTADETRRLDAELARFDA
jgi:cytochrome c-type biogenesis protein CcmH/NrfF